MLIVSAESHLGLFLLLGLAFGIGMTNTLPVGAHDGAARLKRRDHGMPMKGSGSQSR